MLFDSSVMRQAREPATPYAALAPIYDVLFSARFFPRLQRAFEYLVHHYEIRFTAVADVACGTGAFVRYLRECGVPMVWGVDRSPDMLRIAKARNHHLGVRFLLQDFATLELHQPVDLITCNFDSLNYLLTTDDVLHALRRFRANLKPGGHVIFDMITGRSPWPSGESHVERVAWPGITFVRVTRRDPKRHIQTAHVSISRNGRLHREIHVQRGYSTAVVLDLLGQAGFSQLGAHDFHTLGPARASTRRAVYVARARHERAARNETANSFV